MIQRATTQKPLVTIISEIPEILLLHRFTFYAIPFDYVQETTNLPITSEMHGPVVLLRRVYR